MNFGSFIHALQWSCAPDLRVSLAELAVLFVHLGIPYSQFEDEHCTFQALAKWIKSSFAFCRSQLAFDIKSWQIRTAIAHTWGKSMPPGTLCGCRPFFSDDALLLLTRMSAWAFAVAEFR